MAVSNGLNPAFQSIGIGAGITVKSGSGAPAVSAVKGSLFIRTDGSSSATRLYINTDGATTWTPVTTTA